MTVMTSDFFQHVDAFFDYRKQIYEISPETIKSNRVDLRLFETFIKSMKDKTINGTAAIGCTTYLWVEYQAHARYSQKSSQRPLRIQQRRAMILFAPRTVQCMPDCLRRWPITVRQPASTTPEPTNRPCFLKSL